MLNHLVSRAAVLLSVLPIVASSVSPAWADSPKQLPARRLFAAGSDQVLWLVVSEWDENRQEYARRFFYQDAGRDGVQPVTVAPYPQPVSALAVAGDTLHVFRKDGSHVRFNKARRSAAHQLPGQAVPLTVAGESPGGTNRLWAVVSAQTAAQVESEWQERQERRRQSDSERDTAPAKDSQESVSSQPPSASKPKGFRIVMYDGAAWQPGAPMPEDYAGEAQVWLAVTNNYMHLFWSKDSELEQVHYSMYDKDKGTWLKGATISLSGPVDEAAVAVINKQLVFASLVRQPDLSTVRCEQWSRAAAAPIEDPWDKAAALQDDKGNELVLPDAEGSAIGLFSDRLAVFRAGKAEPELATWLAGSGGKQEKPFEPVPALTGREGPASPRGVRDLISTLIVAAVLLLLFWRRQETSMSPLELPIGLHIAGPARRAAAFLIDAAPAAVVVLWYWFDPISSFYAEIQAAAQAHQPMREFPPEVLWAWFGFRVLYITYATVFELLWATTPGKRLLGCRIYSESLQKPGSLQIAIRNLSRMVELEPFLQIWPFMLIVFFTRNRQRLGDLLARTIVVELHPRPDQQDDIPI